MWYIVNNKGDVLGEFQKKEVAETKLSCYAPEVIEKEELEIIDGDDTTE